MCMSDEMGNTKECPKTAGKDEAKTVEQGRFFFKAG